MKKLQIIILIIGLASIIVLAVIYAPYYLKISKYPCPENINNDGAIECHGIISIDGFGEGGFQYSIVDNAQRYTIAEMRSYNGFRFVNNNIYVIDQARDFGLNKLTNEYDKYYYVNGKITNYSSSTKEGMPKYFIVDTATGNVSPYVSIDQVPESERPIFLELEKK